MQFIDLKYPYQCLKDDIEARMQAVFAHGQFIMGPEVRELEAELSDFIGVKHSIAVANGTDALQIALMALDIKPGDEIITTPFTFIATVEVIALLGAKPVFVDIDPISFNLDAKRLEAAITAKTRAIIPVSLYGQCADLDAINAIATKHQLPVIEDAAQSLGATYKGRFSGSLTTIATTSFFPSKPLGAYGDGGACFTQDDSLAERMRQIRIHGQDRRYHHPRLGINSRLDTLQAAILLAKLPLFKNKEIAQRQCVAARYHDLLSDNITVPHVHPDKTSVFAQYTVRIPQRDHVQSVLKAAGIPTAIHYPVPLHLQPGFQHLGYNTGDFPQAEAAAKEVLSLPMHPYLSSEDQQRIAEQLRLAHCTPVHNAL